MDLDHSKRMTAEHAFKSTWFKKFERIELQPQAEPSPYFSPAGPIERSLPDPDEESSHEVVYAGAKRRHAELSDTTSTVGDGKGKGKAPAYKRRELAG